MLNGFLFIHLIRQAFPIRVKKKKKGRFLTNMLLNKHPWIEKKDKINIRLLIEANLNETPKQSKPHLDFFLQINALFIEW